eukprot:TRINITY_DN7998_c0_g1_i4.p1 TRINITY_DN7998_c0_g1~~TRINITY_DN7998_c0_g1_i4.p1  ORF type:complete len:509 (-),score=143.69 TRINITY_DN7998_c0_g1_i4:410-1936(-)
MVRRRNFKRISPESSEIRRNFERVTSRNSNPISRHSNPVRHIPLMVNHHPMFHAEQRTRSGTTKGIPTSGIPILVPTAGPATRSLSANGNYPGPANTNVPPRTVQRSQTMGPKSNPNLVPAKQLTSSASQPQIIRPQSPEEETAPQLNKTQSAAQLKPNPFTEKHGEDMYDSLLGSLMLPNTTPTEISGDAFNNLDNLLQDILSDGALMDSKNQLQHPKVPKMENTPKMESAPLSPKVPLKSQNPPGKMVLPPAPAEIPVKTAEPPKRPERPVRQDLPKQETPKPEHPKPEQPKMESPKMEQPKMESPKPEPKMETPKQEQHPKMESPRPEHPKMERPEQPKMETPKRRTFGNQEEENIKNLDEDESVISLQNKLQEINRLKKEAVEIEDFQAAQKYKDDGIQVQKRLEKAFALENEKKFENQKKIQEAENSKKEISYQIQVLTEQKKKAIEEEEFTIAHQCKMDITMFQTELAKIEKFLQQFKTKEIIMKKIKKKKKKKKKLENVRE